MAAQAKAGDLAKGGGDGSNQHKKATGVSRTPVAAPTLFEMGIDKNLAKDARASVHPPRISRRRARRAAKISLVSRSISRSSAMNAASSAAFRGAFNAADRRCSAARRRSISARRDSNDDTGDRPNSVFPAAARQVRHKAPLLYRKLGRLER